MIPVLDTILLETRFENRVALNSEQIQYLENQFNSTFPETRNQVSINTSHLTRDQQQISKLTENTEFLIKEFLKINENINNLKSNIETLTNRQIRFEENTNENLAALNKKVGSLIKKFKTLSLN